MNMFLKKIKDTRIDKDYEQKDVSTKLGVPRSTYSSWENGDNKINLLYFIKVCVVLDISMDYALGLNNNPNRIFNINDLNLQIIAENLINLCKANNLSQKMLAVTLKYSTGMVSGIINGKVAISLEKLYLLAKQYNFSVDEFCYKKINFIQNSELVNKK